jgi:hypothetical protein
MTTTSTSAPTGTTTGIDPRGPRFTAAITALVLGAILIAPTPVAVVLTAVQAVLFGVGAARGVQHTPHAWAFRALVRPRLQPPAQLEEPAPPRFAQAVGLAFTVVALGCFALGLTLAAQVAIGFALIAALLNAVVGLCLGCEVYLLLRRLTPAT